MWYKDKLEDPLACPWCGISDLEITANGTTYKFKPSKSGTLEEARSMCSADGGMMLFEPRDQASYDAVLEQAKATGQDLIWMNVKQDNQTDKTKP